MTNIVLTWTDPTTRVDGSPLAASDIAGIELFMRVSGAPDFTKINTIAAGIQTFTVTDLPPGEYEFQADVVDKQTPPKVSASVTANAAIVVPPVVLEAPSPVASFIATVE